MGLFSSSTKTPATGYYNLPSDLQGQYNTFYNSIPNATAASNFTVPGTNDYQNQAFANAQQAANPTSGDISNLANTYMNPYNDSVLNQINNQANGQYSILKQSLNDSGGLGSNRQNLAANDIDEQRLNQQNTFLQSQYNTALNTGLQQQQQGITNLLGIGNQQQQQAYQNQQAPYQALTAQAGLLNPAAGFLSNSRPSQTVTTGSGLLGAIFPAYNTAFNAWNSDRRLKQNIEPFGKENGHNLYKFAYKAQPNKKYIGVMADEVEKTHPDAVSRGKDGFKTVDYGKIGVKFRGAD